MRNPKALMVSRGRGVSQVRQDLLANPKLRMESPLDHPIGERSDPSIQFKIRTKTRKLHKTNHQLAGTNKNSALDGSMRLKRTVPKAARLAGQIRINIIWRAFQYFPPLKKIYLHISDHPGEPLSLAEAANIVAMGRTYFASYFHRHAGVTFKYWSDFLRVERAIALFRSSNRTVLDVAQACGFTDATTFSRTFRRIKGVTPIRCRQGLKVNMGLPVP